MVQYIRGIHRHIDRNIPDDTDSLGIGIRFQRHPLPEEEELTDLMKYGRIGHLLCHKRGIRRKPMRIFFQEKLIFLFLFLSFRLLYTL